MEDKDTRNEPREREPAPRGQQNTTVETTPAARRRTEEAVPGSRAARAGGPGLLLARYRADPAVQRARTSDEIYRAVGVRCRPTTHGTLGGQHFAPIQA